MKLTWYKKVILEQKREIIKSATISLFLTLIFSLWYFWHGESFEWHNYKFISEPFLTLRLLSALVFLSLGRILFKTQVYRVLYFIIVKVFGRRDFYNNFKSILWGIMRFIMGFYIVPWIIGIINFILSLLYNLWLLVLYLVPSLGVFLLVFTIFVIIFIRIKNIKTHGE